MSGQHTPGKVRLHSKYPQDVVTDDGMYTLARTLPQPTIAVAEANARRIVACWNMLSGDSTEDIEANVLPDALDLLETHIDRMNESLAAITANNSSLLDQAQELHRQRDMLLAAAQATLAKNLHLADGDNCTLIDLKRAVERITGVPI